MPEQVETTVDDQVSETASSQVEETVENQVGETLDAQTELKKLLTPEVQEQPEVKEEVPETKEVQTKEPEVGIIDDAIIQQYPTLKMYRGKPLPEILKAYHNVTLAYAEDHKKLKQIEKEQAKIALGDISKVPDSIEEKEKFEQWLIDRDNKIRESILSEIPKPQINWVQKVQEVLPAEADVQKVIDSWDRFNSERLYDEMGNLRPEIQSFYNKNPQILINEIKSHYALSSQAEKNAMTVKQEAKNQAYKTVTNSLKKAQETREDLPKASFNQVNRSTESTPEDELLAKIYKIAKGNSPS